MSDEPPQTEQSSSSLSELHEKSEAHAEENNHTIITTTTIGYQASASSGEAVSVQINEDANNNHSGKLASTTIKEHIRSKKDFLSEMFSNKIPSFRKKNSVQHFENNNMNSSAEESTTLISKNCGVTIGYIAPLPKCDWGTVDAPKCLGEMYDDIIRYFFMFMTPKELIIIGGVSRRFRDLSSSDEIWSPIYQAYTFSSVEKDTTITQQFRHEFLRKLKENSTIQFLREESKENVPVIEQVQTCFQCGYGFLAPQIFFTCFAIFSILVPLLMDGFIDISQVGFCSLPFFFALGTYLFISISLLIDPYSLEKKRNKYLEYLQVGALDAGYSNKKWTFSDSEPQEESDFDDGWKESINLSVWHLWIWLLFILGYLSKYIWFAAVYSPFSLLFIPCHVYTIFYCIGPLIFYKHSRSNKTISSDSRLTSYCSYVTNSLLVIISSVQILLIGLKLDGVITTYWNLVLLPAWIFLLFVNCMCCWYAACAGISDGKEGGCVGLYGITAHVLFALFYQVWFIIIALRLDLIITSIWTPLFVPMWLFLSFSCCTHCLCSSVCISVRHLHVVGLSTS
ncbi:hypothetical protein C9374_007809 [Naegleria lovaniensis]|uniref:F-box domain-containing protein n=1 Tax=Naegleria lovaniensis TaxID=51637 RepID=A0AA88GL64_NAELO|nr:uncharacterized protein C9374_007809 [Naegleria lovaniensis]KAG2379171.1 hypothetical protein C9374_007809 [Naegleria lovaniensis]